ncbi:MAG: amidohydrolase family protein [Steroidobacter sp.]
MTFWIRYLTPLLGLAFAGGGLAQETSARPDYVLIDSPVIALQGVRVIDGTSAAPREDQTVILSAGKILALGSSAQVSIPPEANVVELRGRTVLPGLVMLHEHLMYFSGRAIWHSQPVSYPRLYLAAGVTTLRTAGTEHPEVELSLKRRIDQGKTPGPKTFLTGPYFNGPGGDFLGDTVVRNVDEARQAAEFWASRGFTSFKVYDSIAPEALRVIIEVAHARGLKVTGHLRSVGCAEAADLGIDFIEHSFVSCQKDLGVNLEAAGFKADPSASKVQALIRHLVRSRVVLVATPFALDRRLSAEELELLSAESRESYLKAAHQPPPWWPDPAAQREVRKLEKAFVAAGGRLAVGADAMDFGQIAGFANHRALELLVEAGWPSLDVLRIATSQGAELLGVGDSVGRIAAGWAADLIVVDGDPAANIKELSKIEMIFKDGIAYDPVKLRAEAKGLVGWH